MDQARIVNGDAIKYSQPTQLKISPIAAISHKSHGFCSILDLSFNLRLKNDDNLHSVSNTTIKTAPKGTLDQLGHALSWIIYPFAESNDMCYAKIFMAKWDIKDGFWCICCKEGAKCHFTYVLPQQTRATIKPVVPTSLQMGWVEFPPYFCGAPETAHDIAMDYTNTPIGSPLTLS